MSASVYADPWELGQKEKKEGSRLYVVLTESNSVPRTPRGPSRAQEHGLHLSMVWNSGRSGRPASKPLAGVDGRTSQARNNPGRHSPQGFPPLEACALCPGPPDLWCSPDPFQPEEA